MMWAPLTALILASATVVHRSDVLDDDERDALAGQRKRGNAALPDTMLSRMTTRMRGQV